MSHFGLVFQIQAIQDMSLFPANVRKGVPSIASARNLLLIVLHCVDVKASVKYVYIRIMTVKIHDLTPSYGLNKMQLHSFVIILAEILN